MEEQKTTGGGSDVEKNKTMAILSYFIFFLPLLTAKDSKFAMFHANQSLILVLVSIASSVIAAVIPLLGAMVSMVVGLGVLVLWVMGIMNAANGQMKALPLVGNFTILK